MVKKNVYFPGYRLPIIFYMKGVPFKVSLYRVTRFSINCSKLKAHLTVPDKIENTFFVVVNNDIVLWQFLTFVIVLQTYSSWSYVCNRDVKFCFILLRIQNISLQINKIFRTSFLVQSYLFF